MRLLIAGIAFAFPLAALAAPPKTAILDVQNMNCGLCPLTVKQALQKIPGVAEAKVDLDKKTATVTFDADRTGTVALIKATTDAGFPSTARP
jgi:periplasmic mercuric ion binding protein